jgi:hypothetical protein
VPPADPHGRRCRSAAQAGRGEELACGWRGRLRGMVAGLHRFAITKPCARGRSSARLAEAQPGAFPAGLKGTVGAEGAPTTSSSGGACGSSARWTT